MSRKIKFKAWHKDSKKMLSLEKLTPFALNSEYDGDGLFIPFANNLILLQYTGVKDKNGVEIYEGDIFDCVYHFDGCTKHKMIVEWNEERAGFFPRWDYAKCQQKNVTKSMNDLTNLEILGDIYQNKELLES